MTFQNELINELIINGRLKIEEGVIRGDDDDSSLGVRRRSDSEIKEIVFETRARESFNCFPRDEVCAHRENIYVYIGASVPASLRIIRCTYLRRSAVSRALGNNRGIMIYRK